MLLLLISKKPLNLQIILYWVINFIVAVVLWEWLLWVFTSLVEVVRWREERSTVVTSPCFPQIKCSARFYHRDNLPPNLEIFGQVILGVMLVCGGHY